MAVYNDIVSVGPKLPDTEVMSVVFFLQVYILQLKHIHMVAILWIDSNLYLTQSVSIWLLLDQINIK